MTEQSSSDKTYRKGRIIVSFCRDVDMAEGRKLIKSFGLTSAAELPITRSFLVEVPEGEEAKWIKKFLKEDKVCAAEFDYTLKIC